MIDKLKLALNEFDPKNPFHIIIYYKGEVIIEK